MLKRWLKYYFRAETKYRVHSPFVSAWIEDVFEDKRHYYALSWLANLRRRLRLDRTKLQITDFGAGSKHHSNNERLVADLAKHAACTPRKGELLFKSANLFQPKSILELGTSLGLSTLYQHLAVPSASVRTLEGCPQTSAYALKHFKKFPLSENINLITGNFDTTLPLALKQLNGRVDWVLFDGNHRLQPTLDYFERCLPFAHDATVFIFDDIHWSEEMETAWERIKAHPRVTLTIDVFDYGFVFFRPDFSEKKHYTLIPAKYKIWQMGFIK